MKLSEIKYPSYKRYKEKYKVLVELEREEEMERHEEEIRNMRPKEREDNGRAILNIKGKDDGKGLGGNYIVKFVRGGPLPETEISVGDLVMISKNEPLNPDNPTGTVIEKTNFSISVAFNNKPFGINLRGGRRGLTMNYQKFKYRKENENLIIEFFLPKGTYATVFLREFIGNDLLGSR